MITLYVKSNCPFSAKAIEALKQHNVPYEEKNIKDPEVAQELITEGGKRQVPFLEDEDPCTTAGHRTPCLAHDDVHLYESDDIVAYVEKMYSSETAAQKPKGVRLHVEDDSNVCDGCE